MSSDAHKGIFQPLIVAAIVAQATFIVDARSKIAVLETKVEAQSGVVRDNTTYIKQFNKSISKLDATLQVLNERLKGVSSSSEGQNKQ